MTTTEYTVSGMTCSHCENAVSSEVQQIPGVQQVAVSAADGSLRVTSEQPLAEADVRAAVDEAGYELVSA